MHLSSIIIPRHLVFSLCLLDRPAIKNYLHTLFPLDQERKFIFKLKPSTSDGSMSLMVISYEKPLVTDKEVIVLTKDFPDSYLSSKRYQFHVDTVSTKQGMNGEQFNLYHENDIREWFVKKVKRYGFDVNSDQINIREIKRIQINNRGNSWYLPKVTISGILSVTDITRFSDTIFNGFGESRCFGFGLIELKRV